MTADVRVLAADDDSTIAVGRPLVGEHADEFGLAVAATQAEGPILVLGMGLGSAARPVHLFDPGRGVVGVDADATRVSAGRGLFAEHFPDHDVTFRRDLAERFVAHGDHTWAAIWVDLYQGVDYSPLLFDPGFFEDVMRRLAPGGALLVNAFGLPWHLDPLEGSTAQARCAWALRQTGASVCAVPYRRNITFVARATSAEPETLRGRAATTADVGEAPSSLAGHYRALSRLRLRSAVRLSGGSPAQPMSSGTFEEHDRTMKERWTTLLRRLATVGVSLPDDPGDPEQAASFTRRLLETDGTAAALVPAEVGASAGAPLFRPDWLVGWLFDNRRELGSSCSDWMISHALPQSMAEVVHYSRKTVSESAMEQLGVLISEATSWPSSSEAHDDA